MLSSVRINLNSNTQTHTHHTAISLSFIHSTYSLIHRLSSLTQCQIVSRQKLCSSRWHLGTKLSLMDGVLLIHVLRAGKQKYKWQLRVRQSHQLLFVSCRSLCVLFLYWFLAADPPDISFIIKPLMWNFSALYSLHNVQRVLIALHILDVTENVATLLENTDRFDYRQTPRSLCAVACWWGRDWRLQPLHIVSAVHTFSWLLLFWLLFLLIACWCHLAAENCENNDTNMT